MPPRSKARRKKILSVISHSPPPNPVNPPSQALPPEVLLPAAPDTPTGARIDGQGSAQENIFTVRSQAAIPSDGSTEPVTNTPVTTPNTPPGSPASRSKFPFTGGKSRKDPTVVVDNIALAVDVAEKLAGFVQTIPFIGPAAGFLAQIVNVYKEVKGTKDKRQVLVARLTDIASDLCNTILRMEATNHVDLVTRLKPDVEKYASLLEKAYMFISEYDNMGTLRRTTARDQLGSEFGALQQELDSFGTRFRNNRLVDLTLQQRAMQESLDDIHAIATGEKLEKWLGPLPNMIQKQHQLRKLRREGTGIWLPDCAEFIEWQDNAGALWIQGPSGSGKSVLSSAVITKLTADQRLFQELGNSSAIAFFYFDFRQQDAQAVESALRRIILQLSAQSPDGYRALNKHYTLSKGQTPPTYQDLQQVLHELLSG
ncbi:hypothetical protein B0H13DRAFT_2265901, partial [Mycena leptocephala]